jgi:hypothetical protein
MEISRRHGKLNLPNRALLLQVIALLPWHVWFYVIVFIQIDMHIQNTCQNIHVIASALSVTLIIFQLFKPNAPGVQLGHPVPWGI